MNLSSSILEDSLALFFTSFENSIKKITFCLNVLIKIYQNAVSCQAELRGWLHIAYNGHYILSNIF